MSDNSENDEFGWGWYWFILPLLSFLIHRPNSFVAAIGQYIVVFIALCLIRIFWPVVIIGIVALLPPPFVLLLIFPFALPGIILFAVFFGLGLIQSFFALLLVLPGIVGLGSGIVGLVLIVSAKYVGLKILGVFLIILGVFLIILSHILIDKFGGGPGPDIQPWMTMPPSQRAEGFHGK